MILDWPIRAGLCRLWALRVQAATEDYRAERLLFALGALKKAPSVPAILQG